MLVSYEIDSELRRLAEDEPPASLAMIEQNVLDMVSNHRFASPRMPFRAGVAAGAAALLMGFVGGVLPVRPDPSADNFADLLETSRLAPSSLLVERQ